MGSSNSKTGPCPGSGVDRNVVGGIDSRPGKLSSVFCGRSSSSSSRNPTAEMGHPPPGHSDNSVELSRLTVAKKEKPQEHMPMERNCESNSELATSEIKDSSESSDYNNEETLDEITMVEDELDIGGSHVLEGGDYALVSRPTDDDYCREKTCSTSGTSFLQQYSGSTVVNTTSNEDVVAGLSNTEIDGTSGITLEVDLDSVLSPELLGDGHPHILSRVTEAIDGRSSGSVTVSPDSGALFFDSDEVHADVSPSGELPSGLELFWSNREQSQQTDGVVQVDIVAVSSDLSSDTSSDTSSWESRRRGRRMFWDVISRHGSRGQGDSSTIIFATEDSNYLESHDRWPFDSSNDISDDWAEERHFRSRFRRSQRRRRPRSEIWDRLRFGLEASSSQNASCPSGLHPDGLCSCDPILSSEESSSRTSISRIVMLAEALFEVLDELHRQPIFPPLSPVSLPAPGSVVDSFPLKSHQKKSAAENEENDEQCYICLVEYAEGDQIRVLPCKHEYHMHCVDKWLKEVHGICPLCRGDVCDGRTEHNTASDPEIE